MKSLIALVAAGFALAASATTAQASPIVYAGQLSNGVASTGTITQALGADNPDGAVYFSLYANAGSLVQITVRRQSGNLDPISFAHTGLFSDTNQFSGSLFNGPLLNWGDDELPPNLPGPWGDPQYSFIAPTSGFYTVSINSFASAGSPPYNFSVLATGILNVPEPATLGVLGFGLLALGGLGARRVRKA